MNFKRKLLIFLISLIIIPLNTYAYSKYLYLGGENVGITIRTSGVLVVGFYDVNGQNIAVDAGFKLGDRIVSINDIEVNSIRDLMDNINSNHTLITLRIGYIRNNKLDYLNLSLSKDKNGMYRTGIYVKDTITGIGTLTFIDPKTKTFVTLGHEIIDANTNTKFEVSDGNIFKSLITSISKGHSGKPGEKNAKLYMKESYGTIKYNLETGVYGVYENDTSNRELIEVMAIEDVAVGKASIITVLDGDVKETYDIEIVSIDTKSNTKNFLIKITDPSLLSKAGGIIKGMSGSPIIQNSKLVGAVTHTVVDNPAKGYGISVIKMLESIK